MAGFTDSALRRVCRERGAEMLCSEMVSAKAVCYGDRRTAALACLHPDEAPCAIQLFGREPDCLAEAAVRVSEGYGGGIPPAAIDINMGCPMPKITGNGEGGALMKDPLLIEKIVRAVVSRVGALPVTVKLRTGWDEQDLSAVEAARAAEAGGAAMVCVHGRTVRQGYAGTAEQRTLAAVKAAVSVPVVGNGDLRDGAGVRRMLQQTGCDGVMIGRAAVGNPFVFAEIKAVLSGRDYTPPNRAERLAVALRQLRLAAAEKGERTAVLESRKQLAAYLKGFAGAADCRRRINEAHSIEQIEGLFHILLAQSDMGAGRP